jgi:hypothetical protein
MVAVGDHDLDGATDLVTSDAYGHSYVFLGPIEGDRAAASAEAVLLGRQNELAGAEVDLADDLDGDGTPDVVVGAPYGGDSYQGTVFVTAGPVSGHLRLGSVASHVFVGKAFGQLGGGTTSLGDLTGDGIGDLAMASTGSPLEIGLVYLVEGGLAGGTYHPRDVAWASFRSTDAGSNLDVHDVVAHDYDGDGATDLLMADSVAPGFGGFASGEAYGVFGPFSGETRLADADVTWSTEVDLEYFGSSFAAGDVDGDSLLDVAFGSDYADDQDGAVYVQFGPATGSVEALDLLTLRTDARDQLGSTLAIVPDWTGDGGDEIAVGAAWGGGNYYGAVMVFESDSMF